MSTNETDTKALREALADYYDRTIPDTVRADARDVIFDALPGILDEREKHQGEIDTLHKLVAEAAGITPEQKRFPSVAAMMISYANAADARTEQAEAALAAEKARHEAGAMRSIKSIIDEIATEATGEDAKAWIYAEDLKKAVERMASNSAPPKDTATEQGAEQ